MLGYDFFKELKNLKYGNNIRIYEYLCIPSYAYLEFGVPSDFPNTNIISFFEARLKRAFELEYVYILKKDHLKASPSVLPRYLCSVYLCSWSPEEESPEKQCTHLAMAWFQDEQPIHVPGFIENEIKELDWYSVAGEFPEK